MTPPSAEPHVPVCRSCAIGAPCWMLSTAAGCARGARSTARPTCSPCCRRRRCVPPADGRCSAASRAAAMLHSSCCTCRPSHRAALSAALIQVCALPPLQTPRRRLRVRCATCTPAASCTATSPAPTCCSPRAPRTRAGSPSRHASAGLRLRLLLEQALAARTSSSRPCSNPHALECCPRVLRS